MDENIKLENVAISIALPDEAFELSLIHKRSWVEAYKDLLPADYLMALSDSHWVSLFERTLPDPSVRSWILRLNSKPVACAFVSPSRYEGYEADLEVNSIYCIPEYWGNGFGKTLFPKIVEYARDNKFSRICLWVLAGNKRGIRFYQNMGFYEDGVTMQCTIGGKEMTEIRFVKKIIPS